jgi:hypothetical protein
MTHINYILMINIDNRDMEISDALNSKWNEKLILKPCIQLLQYKDKKNTRH